MPVSSLRFLFLLIFAGASSVLFGQREIHGNSTPWNVFAGYIQPVGKWTKEAEFTDDNSSGGLGYSYAFSGRTGLHARSGFTIGLTYDKTYLKRSGSSASFELFYSPVLLNTIFYDLKSEAPAIESSKIKPLLQLETAIAPCCRMNAGAGVAKLYLRAGVSVKHTSGEVHYIRNNFEQPVTYPAYSGNDIYMDHTTYSYTGAGIAVGPGFEFTIRRFGIGSEFHSEFSTGTYKGTVVYKDYYGNERIPTTQNLKNQIYFSKFLNVYVSYAFGIGR